MSLYGQKGDDKSTVSKVQHHKCGQRLNVNCLIKKNAMFLLRSCLDLRFLLAISDCI